MPFLPIPLSTFTTTPSKAPTTIVLHIVLVDRFQSKVSNWENLFRASWSNFIIPAPKFLKTVDYPFCIGMRFKARVESEDASERRLYISSFKRTFGNT